MLPPKVMGPKMVKAPVMLVLELTLMRAVLPLLPKVRPPKLPNCPLVKVMGALKLVLSG